MDTLPQNVTRSTEIAEIMEIEKRKTPATTSLKIAESFNKEHKDVIRAIETLLESGEFNRRNFALVSYTDERNRKQKMYVLDETLSTVLIMGFTGSDVLKWKIRYTLRFQELRSSLENHSQKEMFVSIFLSKHINPWVKTFHIDFFKHLCRLKNVKFDANKPKFPAYFGHLVNNIVYQRIAPHVADYLKKNTPRFPCGQLKHKYHQNFNQDYGCKELREHLVGVIAIMRSAFTWDEFENRLNTVYPRYGKEPEGNLLWS